MNQQQFEAVTLFGHLTSGFYDAYRVAGSQNGAHRARILGGMLGKKMPISKAGVNAVREAFFDLVQPEGNCLAARENDALRKLQAMGFEVHPNALN